MLAIIADALIQVISFLASHHDIVADSTKLTIFGQRPLKGFWLVQNQLHVQVAFTVQLCNLLFQHIDNILCQWLFLISPYTMACFDSFFYCHLHKYF